MATTKSIVLGATIVGVFIFAGLAIGPILHHQELSRKAERERQCDLAILELEKGDFRDSRFESLLDESTLELKRGGFEVLYESAVDLCGWEKMQQLGWR